MQSITAYSVYANKAPLTIAPKLIQVCGGDPLMEMSTVLRSLESFLCMGILNKSICTIAI